MKHRCRCFAIAMFATLTLCLAGSSPDRSAVRIAVFEAMFAEHRDVQGLVLFIAIGDRAEKHRAATSDPSDEILVPLLERGWQVEPASAAAPFDKVDGVKHARTGHQGLWFYAGRLKWLSSSEVVAYGEYYRDGTSAEGAEYRVVRQADAWKVVSRASKWKS